MRAIVLTAAVGALLSLAGPAAGAEKLPVPWTFTVGENPSADRPPPGANDFDCRPPKRHPHPVVLAHGLMATQAVNWQTISPFLANRGFCVFTLTYGRIEGNELPGIYAPGGLERMQLSARELKRFVNRVLRRTGARKVDIVGHSEGSLMPNYYVRFLDGAKRVDDYVGLTTLWDGTNLAAAGELMAVGRQFGWSDAAVELFAPLCRSCLDFAANSEFMEKMNAGGVAEPGVTYTNIVTRYDELVIPYTSGLMEPGPNVTNVVVQDHCELDLAEHLAVAADPVTAGFIYRALDPTRAPEPPCVPVLPGLGAVGYSGS
jgi:triacylglycerol esterase/lipase EstA (alpha/beta hydrolase family)